jgi:hypothetical protein
MATSLPLPSSPIDRKSNLALQIKSAFWLFLFLVALSHGDLLLLSFLSLFLSFLSRVTL